MDDFDDWLNTTENEDWDFYPEETSASDLEYWRNHLKFLQTHYPDDYEEIAYAQFNVQKITHPQHADYYDKLDEELTNLIQQKQQNIPDFGFEDVQAITRDFLEAKGLTSLLYL
jgi:hypothetical protein